MGKLLPARWKTVLLVVLAGLVTLYLLLPRGPALVRRGRDAGPWQGYQDCSPADRVAFVFKEDIENSDFFNLHNVIARYAFNNNLVSSKIVLSECSIITVGFKPKNISQSLKCSKLRNEFEDDVFIIATSELYVKQSDLTVAHSLFDDSLIVMKNLLCLSYKDISYHDIKYGSLSQAKEEMEALKQLHQLIKYFGLENVEREKSILEHTNSNIRSLCEVNRNRQRDQHKICKKYQFLDRMKR